MKRVSITVLAFAFCAFLLAGEPKWVKGDYEKALAQAQEKRGHILVDFYATWCAPCKEMDQTTFKDESFAKALQTLKLVPLKLDADKEGEALAGKYGVRALPTILILDAHGGDLGRVAGYRNASELVGEIKKILQDPRTEEDLRSTLEKSPQDVAARMALSDRLQYKEGRKAQLERLGLLREVLQADRDNAKGLGAQALVDLTAIGLSKASQVHRIAQTAETLDRGSADLGLFLIAEPDLEVVRSAARLSEVGKSLEAALTALYVRQLKSASEIASHMEKPAPITEALSELQSDVTSNGTYGNRLLCDAYFDFLALVETGAAGLNEIAFYNYMTQRRLGESAELARRSLGLAPDPNTKDTLAHLLYSLGEKDEALRLQREAVEEAKKLERPNAPQLAESLQSLERGELDQLLDGVAPAMQGPSTNRST